MRLRVWWPREKPRSLSEPSRPLPVEFFEQITDAEFLPKS
jgi:hypothetical protein